MPGAVVFGTARWNARKRTGPAISSRAVAGKGELPTLRPRSGERSPSAVQKQVQELVVAAMRCAQAGDRSGEAIAYSNLGNAYYRLGQFDKAIEFHHKHLNIALGVGDRAGEGTAYGNLGNGYYSLGQFDKGIEFHHKRLNIALEVGDRAGEGRAYHNLFVAYGRLGQVDKATEFQQKCETLRLK